MLLGGEAAHVTVAPLGRRAGVGVPSRRRELPPKPLPLPPTPPADAALVDGAAYGAREREMAGLLCAAESALYAP